MSLSPSQHAHAHSRTHRFLASCVQVTRYLGACVRVLHSFEHIQLHRFKIHTFIKAIFKFMCSFIFFGRTALHYDQPHSLSLHQQFIPLSPECSSGGCGPKFSQPFIRDHENGDKWMIRSLSPQADVSCQILCTARLLTVTIRLVPSWEEVCLWSDLAAAQGLASTSDWK